MGVPTWEVGYTSAMPRREDHEVRQGHVGHWIKKKKSILGRVTFTIMQKPKRRIFTFVLQWQIIVQGGSNMTGTDLCVNLATSVPVIFEPPRNFE